MDIFNFEEVGLVSLLRNFRSLLTAALVLLWLGLVPVGLAADTGSSNTLRIFYNGALRSSIEPCG
jgi:hypothetical protein